MSGIPKDLPMGSQGGFVSPQAVAEEEARNRDEGRAALARESMREVQMFSGRGGRPETPERFEPKTPTLPADLDAKASELGERVYKHGVAIDTSAVLERGRVLFERLLELDVAERGLLGFTDLTDFHQVKNELRRHGALQPPSALIRSPREQVRGLAGEKAAALRVESIDDLWRFATNRLVRSVLAFHNSLTRLVFGRSLLRADENSRIRSRWFTEALALFRQETTPPAGGDRQSEKAKSNSYNVTNGAPERGNSRAYTLERLFDFWRDVFRPAENASFVVISFERPLWSLLGWLANDGELVRVARNPSYIENLTKDLFDHHSVDLEQERIIEALVESFLRGVDFAPFANQRDPAAPLSALQSWIFVGARVGRSIEPLQLATWRKELVEGFPGVSEWHRAFVSESMAKSYTQDRWQHETSLPALQFDPITFRDRVNTVINERLATIYRLAALAAVNAIGEGNKLIGVLPGQIIIESPARGVIREQLIKKLEREITSTLASAFEPDTFSFKIESREVL
jgi:hypothetical protein